MKTGSIFDETANGMVYPHTSHTITNNTFSHGPESARLDKNSDSVTVCTS